MVILLKFFAGYAPLIYLVLALGFIFTVRGLIRSLRARQMAVFGLERELSQGQLNRSLASLILVLLLFMAELLLQAFLVPTLPSLQVLSTPTLSVLSSPGVTLVVPGSPESGTPEATPTAQTSDCIPGQIMITAPKAGATLTGVVTVTGTANIPDFGFYKYEFKLMGGDTWSTILAGRDVVQDGELGLWDTSQLTNGDYLLRLVITNNQGNSFPACMVQIRISNQ